MYSISEAAKKLGVSRQSIYNKLDREELKVYIHLTEKGKMLDSEGLEVLKGLYPVKADSQQTVNGQSEDGQWAADGQDSDKYINIFKEQLEYLKSVISEKDKQLEAYQEQTANLTRLLENSQVLLKQQQERILALEEPKQNETEGKKSWFRKWFD